jgi:hypothetical protein
MVLIAILAIGSTLDSAAQAAIQDKIAAVAPATRKSKPPPVTAPPPSEHYAAAHAVSTGHPWKF